MRGRHSAAMLEMIGIRELIADTVEGFVALAIRMGRDADLRQAMRRRIADSKSAIYQDNSAIAGLAEFIERAVMASA